jgi:FKBP12-rapamycin complex-associated protein
LQESVRNKAAVLLNRCLAMVAQRDNKTTKPSSFVLILQEAQKGISSTSPDVIQGSLLMYRELLKTTGMFMTDYYGDTCEKILNHRTHKDLAVRKTVISILPVCAHYNPAKFTEHFLFRSMSWLLQQMTKQGERTQGKDPRGSSGFKAHHAVSI